MGEWPKISLRPFCAVCCGMLRMGAARLGLVRSGGVRHGVECRRPANDLFITT
jgi:hypothetical protein